MGSSLVALGGALPGRGAPRRGGRRIGLPTIPLFMIAGIIFGPNTPGISLIDDPADLELLATLGLVLLLFYLGLEFSLDDLAGGRPQPRRGAIYLALNIGAALALRLRARLGRAGSARHRRRDRDLVVGHRHQAARRAAPARQPRDAA